MSKLFTGFKIVLPPDVENKIMYWVNKCDKEISGLGDAYLDIPNKQILIQSAFLLEQECGSAETEIDEKSIAKAMGDAHADESNHIPRNIKFWWHSHVNMGVFWSTTDTTTMHKLSEHGWFVNIVFNKKYQRLGAISYPLRTVLNEAGMNDQLAITNVEYESDIPIQGAPNFAPAILEEFDAQYLANYKEKTYGNYNYPNNTTTRSVYSPNSRSHDFRSQEDYYADLEDWAAEGGNLETGNDLTQASCIKVYENDTWLLDVNRVGNVWIENKHTRKIGSFHEHTDWLPGYLYYSIPSWGLLLMLEDLDTEYGEHAFPAIRMLIKRALDVVDKREQREKALEESGGTAPLTTEITPIGLMTPGEGKA